MAIYNDNSGLSRNTELNDSNSGLKERKARAEATIEEKAKGDSEYLARGSPNLNYFDTDKEAELGSVDASKTLANLNRKQWEDFKGRFGPYVEKLSDIAQGPSDAERAQGLRARSDTVDTQFDNAEGAAARRSEGFGMSYDPSQTQQRSTAMDKAAATVGSRNQYRSDIESRKNKAMTGSGGSMGLGNAPSNRRKA